jgi:hypothetical protein
MTDNTVPTITVGGRAWPIPPLAFKQLKVILPALGKIGPQLNLLSATEEQLEALGTAVYIAITRGTPELKRAEFDDMAMGPAELLQSLPVVIRQTGFGETEGSRPLA